MYLTFFVVVIGFVGNIFNILLFSSRELFKSSSDVYLLCLAIVDTIYLIALFLSRGLTDIRCLYLRDYAFDIFNRNTFACQFLQYVLDGLSDFSSCVVVSFTFERVIACYRPVQFKIWCTPIRALISCCTSFAVVFASIAPYHFLFIGRPNELNVCTILPGGEHMFSICYICEMTVYKIAPVTCVAICNFFIFYRLSKQSNRMSTVEKRGSENSQQNHDCIQRGDSYSPSNLRAIVEKCKAKTVKRNSGINDRTRKATIVLICVSTCYTISVIPAIIHFVLHRIERVSHFYISPDVIDITLKCARILYIAGFSMNFFLYTLTGNTLRKRFKDKITCCKKRPNMKNRLSITIGARSIQRRSRKAPTVVVESCVDNDIQLHASLNAKDNDVSRPCLDEPSTQLLALSSTNLNESPGSSSTSIATSCV